MKTESSASIYNTVWQFLSSVKLTVFVLLSLALTSIIGTLIPQNENPAEYVRAFGEFYYRIFYVLDIFDMYHSWWFQLLLILLVLNVVVCSVDRLSSSWKIIFVKKPSFQLSRFQRADDRETFTVPADVGSLQSLYAPQMSRAFSHSRVEPIDRGVCLFGEKGRWTRLGVYAVHLSVVLLLLGGLIGSLFGFEGFVNITEGETVASIRLRSNNSVHPLGFEIRCDDFNISFYASGMPSEYRSRLTILENGKPALQKDIIVNDPLRYRGINLYQSSYGKLPPRQVTLQIESQATGMRYKKTAAFGQVVAMPENLGTFTLRDYQNNYPFRGQNIGEVFLGTLSQDGQAPADIILPTRFPAFDKMRKGPVALSVAQFEPRYYTGLQVTRDPGVWVVYAGFMVMILGCFVTFFMSHQSLCIEITAAVNGSQVTVSGLANKNKLGLQQKIVKFSEKLKRLNPTALTGSKK